MTERNSAARYADRPPRIQPELPEGREPIPKPPEEGERGFSARQALLPLITIVGYIFISFTGQGRNLLFILPMGLSVLASAAFTFLSFRDERRRLAQKRRDYALLLAELRREMVASHDRQRSFYEYNYPDPHVTLQIDGKNRDNRSGSRLWERRTDDEDFGVVRLGVGARPSTVIYEAERGENEEDEQMRDAIKLDTDSRTVFDVPITIPLYRPLAVEGMGELPVVRHALGIAGNPEDVYPVIRAITTHYTTFHAPADANLHVVGVHRAAREWDWIYAPPDRSDQRAPDLRDRRAAKPLLPHFVMPKSDRDGVTFPVCFEEATGKADLREDDPVARFWKHLRTELDRREYRLREDRERGFNNIPFLVIIVDMLDAYNPANPDAYLADSMLKDVEQEAAIADLLNKGLSLGAALIFLVPTREKVPSGCTAVIEVSSPDEHNVRDFRYAEVGVNTPRYIGAADVVENAGALQGYAERLQRWAVRQSYGEGIPDSATLLEINNARSIEDLRISETWALTANATKAGKDEDESHNADWMRAAIGIMSNEEIRRLYFKSDADGVHGMIAGATGSGKSELLMSLILGLAVSYDPSVVNFVLIDYKGGGAFVPLKNMPHIVDIVTNLQLSAVDRMFKAITAELNRRQEINTVTDSKHIVDYRSKGLHLLDPKAFEQRFGREKEPYPHLFIIIDEFAEMMEGDNEYKEQLNRITRLGRALGVSLILAAQRPSGVTDQMRSNIQLRISLRVATPAESSELLRRPDAAFLPNGIPGRGYVQVGQDSLELIQMAWSGAPYREDRQLHDPDDAAYWEQFANQDVIWMDQLEGEREPRALFEVLVDRMAALAREQSEPQRKPWPDPLTEYLPLGAVVPEQAEYLVKHDRLYLEAMTRTLIARRDGTEIDPTAEITEPLVMHPAIAHWLAYEPQDGEFPYMWGGVNWRTDAMRPVIGLIDDAANAKQRLLIARLRQGNLVIFGAPGWGKSTFLRTVITSLCATHSPAELHVYILDFGSQALTVLEGLPHVGAVITPDETERIDRLLRKLDALVETRIRMFREQSVNDLYSYNLTNPDHVLPAVLVVVDNFAEIKENMETVFTAFLSLAREGGRAGVHIVGTGEGTGSFGKLYNLFTERLTLKLADSTEYMSIVGRGVRHVEDIPGRGFVAVDRTPLELQTCIPVAPSASDRAQQRDETSVLREFVAKMADAWEKSGRSDDLLPETVENLPPFITFSERLDYVEDSHLPPEPAALIGMDDASLSNVWVEFQRTAHFLIVGQQQSGKTNAMRAIIMSLALYYSPDEARMILIDRLGFLFDYAGMRNLAELPHVIAAVTEPDEMKDVLRHLRYEFEEMPVEGKPHELYVFIDNYDDFEELAKPSDLSGFTRQMPGRPRIHFIVAGSDIKMRAQDDLTRRISRNGLAMENKTAQAQPFNGSLPRNLREAELPVGRSFLIRSGQVAMLQTALIGSTTETTDKALDRYVFLALRKYPDARAAWVPIPEAAAVDQETTVGYTPEQMAWIRRALAEKMGLSVESLEQAGIDDEAILREATNEGILTDVPSPEAIAAQSNGAAVNGDAPAESVPSEASES